MAESIQKFTVRVPVQFNEAIRTEVANDIIKFILIRTERGLDKNNKKFDKYSESYSESLDFKIAGKRKNHVDLQLTGDMLTEMQILNVSVAGFITIGFEAGTEENDKAAWQRNNLRPSFPKRDFLGITDKDLNNIVNKYKIRTNIQIQQQQEQKEKITEEAQRIISGFLFNR